MQRGDDDGLRGWVFFSRKCVLGVEAVLAVRWEHLRVPVPSRLLASPTYAHYQCHFSLRTHTADMHFKTPAALPRSEPPQRTVAVRPHRNAAHYILHSALSRPVAAGQTMCAGVPRELTYTH